MGNFTSILLALAQRGVLNFELGLAEDGGRFLFFRLEFGGGSSEVKRS